LVIGLAAPRPATPRPLVDAFGLAGGDRDEFYRSTGPSRRVRAG
jgi:hypothetical protein